MTLSPTAPPAPPRASSPASPPACPPAAPAPRSTAGREAAQRPLSAHRVTAKHWPLVAALNAEWAALAHRPTIAPDGTPWAATAPALEGLDTLADVLEAIASGDRTGIDQILHALLVLHANGDELAGRTVLQTMLGRVVRTRTTARQRQITFSEAESIAAQWEMIATYPLHRTTSVAANLALGALNLLVRSTPQLPAYRTSTSPAEADQAASGDYSPTSVWASARRGVADLTGAPVDAMNPTAQIVETLRWAKETGALTKPEIELLVRVHLNDDSDACLAEAGAAMGLTYPAVRQRYSRTLRKLHNAVHASLTHPLAG